MGAHGCHDFNPSSVPWSRQSKIEIMNKQRKRVVSVADGGEASSYARASEISGEQIRPRIRARLALEGFTRICNGAGVKHLSAEGRIYRHISNNNLGYRAELAYSYLSALFSIIHTCNLSLRAANNPLFM